MPLVTLRLVTTETPLGEGSIESVVDWKHIQERTTRRLTSKKASQILAREFPELQGLISIVVRTPRGWMASTFNRSSKSDCLHPIRRRYYVATMHDVDHLRGKVATFEET